MSGLVGVFSRSGDAVERSTLEAMLATVEHRGPDGTAVWHDGAVGLGNARLVTTPEAAFETLPLVAADGRLALAADARVDNRPQLVDRLDVDTSGTVTDADLVLAAYRRWGVDCPTHLVGAYAFVVWDAERRRLVCARDHAGVRPLYYAVDDERCVVGSEPKALFAAGDVPRVIDEAYVGDYLTYNLADVAATPHAAVRRLPPGHTLTVREDGLSVDRYWALDPDRELDVDPAAAVAGFRERFDEAVRCRLRSPGPVGAMLSGGLDSSAIVCTARAALADAGRPPLHAYSVGFEAAEPADERAHVDAVLAEGGVEAHRLAGDRLDPLAALKTRLERFDGPFDPYLQHIAWHLYGAAADDVRVLLDGYDGDTVVSHGVGRLSELFRSGRWLALAREVGALADDWSTRWSLLRDHAVGPSVPGPLRAGYRSLADGRGPVERANPAIDALFAERVGLADRLERDGAPTTARERQHRLLTDGKLARVLELADHAAATFRLKPRYPFLDRRLMEFCLALPVEYKLRDGRTRWVLREAMAGVLPESVRQREDKADLHAYLVDALTGHGAINGLADVDGSELLARYVDVDALRRTRRRFEAGRSVDDALVLARAAVLREWLSSMVE